MIHRASATPKPCHVSTGESKVTHSKTLPPDPEGMNEDRSRWAEAAIHEFQRQTGADLEDSVSDLLADLMHWCDRNGIDFDTETDRARRHYDEETEDIPVEEG
jgi:hypothetical protein